MSVAQESWLARHLEDHPELVVAERALRALGPAALAHVVEALERFARKHEVQATLAFAQAPEVWAAGGQALFTRWLQIGERLLLEPPISRAGASRYFSLPLRALRLGGLDTAEAWCALGRELTAQAPYLGRMFFEHTVPLLEHPEAVPQLRAWVQAAAPLLAEDDWRAGLVLEAYFESAATSVFGLRHPHHWLNLARALTETIDPRRLLARAPSLLSLLTPADEERLLKALARWGNESPEATAVLLEHLPPLFQRLMMEEEPEALAALCAVLHRLPGRAARGLAALLPGVGEALGLPSAVLRAYLLQIEPLAEPYPEAALAALRALPELHRRAEPVQALRWFAHGERLARESVAAAQAFFALESRTSLRVLAAGSGVAELDQNLGMWRKLICMLSDRSVVVRRLDTLGLRPPLEAAEPEAAVSLPEYVDWFPTQAQNLMVYRFLTLQLAGRLEHGTYHWRGPQGRTVQQELESEPERANLRQALFLVAEGVRIAAWTGRAYPGTTRETVQLARSLLDVWQHEGDTDLAHVCDVLLALSLADLETESPRWASVPAEFARAACGLLSRLQRVDAGVDASLLVADRLALLFDHSTLQLSAAGLEALEAVLAHAAMEEVAGAALSRNAAADASPPAAQGDGVPDAEAASADVGGDADAAAAAASDSAADADAGAPDTDADAAAAADTEWTAEDWAADEAVSAARGGDEDFRGRPSAQSEDHASRGRSSSRAASAASRGRAVARRQRGAQTAVPLATVPGLQPTAAKTLAGASHRPRPSAQLAQSYVYDEWDHTLSDYRSRHCHVHELPLGSDQGAFFDSTLRDNRELLAQVRRQFEHMRPERYRVLRGLEDGEDFDLNALTEARVESRAGRTANTRIYTARTRQTRDVATLFLLDMSASTEQPYADPTADEPARRIIDTLKEALVVMCTALDTLGDAYAIYGFSSQGRRRVELYEVKAFDQPLGAAAKARLGSIGPRHGTRMGAALRHSLTKFASVQAHSRHLILLSDGFPQDQEYGEDRRTHTYGMKDTAVALRELSRAGTLPFCITVDRAGHDYLRLMCDPDQYMVIDHIEQLPRELPKIYRRIVR